MKNEWNDIENLFKSSLNSIPDEAPVDPWADIEKRVKRSNFFSYSKSSFNVYYLAIVMILISTMGYSAYKITNYLREMSNKNEITRQKAKHKFSSEKILFITDSINNGIPSVDSVNFNMENKINSIKNGPPSSNNQIHSKANGREECKQTEHNSSISDTVTLITIRRKVVKKQTTIKKVTLAKDSIIIN